MKWDKKEYAKIARQTAAEGIVLLRNEDQTLPLQKGEKVSVFGRAQLHYYRSGTGSGGAVNVDYEVGIYEAIKKSGLYDLNEAVRNAYEVWEKAHPYEEAKGWGEARWSQDEMPLTEAFVHEASRVSNVALFIIGRTAGEDQDNKNEKGSFLLTDEESTVLALLCRLFKKTVVLLNTGNIIDMRWVNTYRPDSVLYVWQGGQEGGNGVLDVLSGAVTPSGKLTDTIAYSLEDYPSTANFGNEDRNIQSEDIYVGYRYFETFAKDKVLYPFGFGLSYTEFSISGGKVDGGEGLAHVDRIAVSANVKNIGGRVGKEVLQVYVEAPQGRLGKAARVLCGFVKTDALAPGACQMMHIPVPVYAFASYDDGGVTGNKSCYVLESGEYHIYLGTDCASAQKLDTLYLDTTRVISVCNEALAPVKDFSRMKPVIGEYGSYTITYEPVPKQTILPSKKREENIPECKEFSGDQGFVLKDVCDGRTDMDTFLAQLNNEQLCTMVRGEGFCSPKVTPGVAGAFGGVSESLKKYGIPVAACADGPSGIRMDCGMHAFSLPNGTCIASAFNTELTEKLFQWEGLELRKNQIDLLLGPGLNIHRNPLNGRNFEYFSEDPFLSGKIAAAQLRGMHNYGVSGTIKHFACNTQEYKRNRVDAVISERAVREIYLKGFEIAVKEGGAKSIMSTYGPINGIWTAGNYDLLTSVLRNEWGYTGIVMTDWWALANDAAGADSSLKNTAAMIRAQNDLNMVTNDAEANSGGDNLMESLDSGSLTRGELIRTAKNICNYLMDTPAFKRFYQIGDSLDQELQNDASQEELAMLNRKFIKMNEEVELDTKALDLTQGVTTCFDVGVKVRGYYDISFDIRSRIKGNPLAQLPISIFKDQMLIETITLSGEDVKWQHQHVQLGLVLSNSFYIRFFVAQTGLEIKNMKIILREDIEDKIKMLLASRETKLNEES